MSTSAPLDTLTRYPEHANNNWSFNSVHVNEVVTAMEQLPNKKSTGIDEFPIRLLKVLVLAIAPIITICINVAIQTTIFPVELLKGRLKLIHKQGDSDIENVRGLTLLPSISKVFRKYQHL